jgi:hypothetical protein
MPAKYADGVIEVRGLRELQAALRRIDGQSQKELRVVLNEAAKVVSELAAQRMPRRSGRAAASLKARSGQREAAVQGGSARVPYYAWLDFGGSVGRKGSVHRPFLRDGRYMYPAYRDRKATVQEKMEEGLAALVRKSGLEVS